MANSLATLQVTILARALSFLRKRATLPRIVLNDFGTELASPGQTVTINTFPANSASDVTPGATPPAPTDTTPTKVTITLNKHKKANFHLTSKETQEISRRDDYITRGIETAVDALAKQINSDLHDLYTQIYSYTGTAGTTPFASNTNDIRKARQLMNDLDAPAFGPRFAVLDGDAEFNVTGLSNFLQANVRGSDVTILTGEMGRAFGHDWLYDNQVKTHTAGTGASMQTSAAGSVGDKTIGIDTGTGTLVVGDVVSFAGHSQTYVVTTAVADVSSATMAFLPGLKAAVADNEAITLRATHVVNQVFHRDAMAVAMRPGIVSIVPGINVQTLVDPVTGLSMTLHTTHQYHQDVWELSVLYGVQMLRPELAARIAG